MRSLLLYCSGLAITICMLCSCGNTRNLIYMQGKFDTANLSKVSLPEPTIQKGDMISIIVYSDNPAATAIFNQSVSPSASAAAATSSSNAGGGTGSMAGATGSSLAPSAPGYLVDEHGNIEFQGLGTLHIEGLTKTQLKDTLNVRLADYLNHPYYTIRFMNYRFTILGEVAHPGIFSIPGEHVSLLEALGLAGDMTFYGRRDNVLVMREVDGKRQWARLDLTKPDILASPYYYLQQNDVVIIEPTKRKVVANDQVTTRNVTIAASVVSTLAILYSIFRK